MLKPFHLSFYVADLNATRKFYQEILGCSIGREQPMWMDLDFFGHQITVHQVTDERRCTHLIDHFGVILEKSDWKKLVDFLKTTNVEFVLEPRFSKLGKSDEQAKFMIKDLDGNVLEFKYYMDFRKTLCRVDV